MGMVNISKVTKLDIEYIIFKHILEKLNKKILIEISKKTKKKEME